MGVRVAQVERLADVVVGQADQRHTVARSVCQPRRQVGARRHQQGEVVEAGAAVGRYRPRLLDQVQQLCAAGAERGLGAVLAEQLQADRPAVVVEGALKVGDRQMHGPERELRGEPSPVARRRGLELLGILGRGSRLDRGELAHCS